MDLNQALDTAQQMQNHFEAFKTLADTIATIRAVDPAEISRLTGVRDGLSADIQANTVKLQAIKDTIMKAQSDAQAKQQSNAEQTASLKASLDADLLRYTGSVDAQKKALDQDLAKKEQDHAAQVATMNDEISALASQRDSLRTQISQLRDQATKILQG